jgi:hypothetical protein
MPRRTLLSAEARSRLFGIPTERAEMARHYVLDEADLALVRARRRAANRLGFAVQLCLLRHPGTGLGPGEHPPVPMLAFVAEQLGVSPAAFAGYAARDQTRREHAAELGALLRLRSFHLADWRSCLRLGAEAAWATDRGEPIVAAMLAHLRREGIIVPSAAVLERIGLAARARARRLAFARLTEGMGDAERAALDGMLKPDPALRGRSRFAWLRDAPEAPGPGNILALLDRLEWVRALGVDTGRAERIHPARLARLVEEEASPRRSTSPAWNRRAGRRCWSRRWLSCARVSPTRPSPCSASTPVPCSPRPATAMTGASRPPDATSPAPSSCSAARSRRCSGPARPARRAWPRSSVRSAWSGSRRRCR